MRAIRWPQLILATAIAGLGACSTVTPPAHAPPVPAEALNPDVTPETIDATICVTGYTAAVRPSTTYTKGVKAKLLRESGHSKSGAAAFELDHVIPLGLGGHPRNLRNLALQPWDGDGGARMKDRLEVRLQRLVCSHRLGLRDAQAQIYLDWRAAYRSYVGTGRCGGAESNAAH